MPMIGKHDKNILRELARHVRDIVGDRIQQQRRQALSCGNCQQRSLDLPRTASTHAGLVQYRKAARRNLERVTDHPVPVRPVPGYRTHNPNESGDLDGARICLSGADRRRPLP